MYLQHCTGTLLHCTDTLLHCTHTLLHCTHTLLHCTHTLLHCTHTLLQVPYENGCNFLYYLTGVVGGPAVFEEFACAYIQVRSTVHTSR
jgi:hypothetical protein